MNKTARTTSIYSIEDLDSIRSQIKSRWLAVALPCVLLLAGIVVSLVFRQEIITTACTILLGAILIFCWDLLIKPLNCYRKHLENVLFGRVHAATLPFVFLSEEINVVDGVACRMLTCQDTDAKGRLYDRLFYLDAEKSCPEFKEGEMVLVLHHDLIVADVTAA